MVMLNNLIIIICDSGSMKILNGGGPGNEPWGYPHVTPVRSVNKLPIDTKNCQLNNLGTMSDLVFQLL